MPGSNGPITLALTFNEVKDAAVRHKALQGWICPPARFILLYRRTNYADAPGARRFAQAGGRRGHGLFCAPRRGSPEDSPPHLPSGIGRVPTAPRQVPTPSHAADTEQEMALKITTGRAFPIGIDLGTSAVKMAQMRREDQALELLAAGSAPLGSAEEQSFTQRLDAVGAAIRGIMKSDAFRGNECVISLPAECTFVQHVKIPKGPAEEVSKAIQWELQGKLPFPPGDAVIRHIVAGDAFGDHEAKQEVIVVAAARALLDSCLAMARRCKLDVAGINIEPCALVECFSRLFRRTSDASRTILYVDLGAASTQVAMSHGSRIVFARNLNIGGNRLDKVVAEGLGIAGSQARQMRRDLAAGHCSPGAQDELYHLLDAPLEGLCQELALCMQYYDTVFRNQAVERVIFLGGGAYDKRLCQSIAERLNLTAQIGDPLIRVERVGGAGLACGLDRREPQPDWAVAVGLSLGAEKAA